MYDVLAHEIGHHVAQQYRREPVHRALRTTHHEAFAEAFARRFRLHQRTEDGL